MRALPATFAALLLGGCATGFEAHDQTLKPMRIELRQMPLPQVREYCRDLLRNTESMGCATVRAPGSDNSKPAMVGERVVIAAGFDCRITVAPSIRLREHELARCAGGTTYASLPVVKHGDAR